MDAPYVSLELEIPTSPRAKSSKSFSLMVQDKYEDDASIQGTRKFWVQVISTLLISSMVLAYLIVAGRKLHHDIYSLQISSNVVFTSSYQVPLLEICRPQSDSAKRGTISPRLIRTSNVTKSTVICSNSNNDSTCSSLLTNNLPVALDRNSWKILNFTDEGQQHCLAVVPPLGATFSVELWLEFDFIADDPSAFNTSSDSFLEALQHEWDYHMLFGVLHPNEFDAWYDAIRWTNDSQSQDYISAWYIASLWSNSNIEVSLYTKEVILKERIIHQVTSNQSVYGSAFLAKVYDRHLETAREGTNNVIPAFAIVVDTDIISYDEQGNPNLFQSYSQEFEEFGWFDFISGIGGVLSFSIKVGGLFVGMLLTAQGCCCIHNYWTGIAPHPPLDENFEYRLRRVIHREVTDIMQQHYNL